MPQSVNKTYKVFVFVFPPQYGSTGGGWQVRPILGVSMNNGRTLKTQDKLGN